ncbi:MAG: hypothetical protein ABIT38_16515 [Gemmatimonadaceae bacterium]
MTPRTWDVGAIAARLESMTAHWSEVVASEKAALQSFVLEFCAALGATSSNATSKRSLSSVKSRLTSTGNTPPP